MSPELKARWVAALRSGEYRQGRGALCINDAAGPTYCCLGVLSVLEGLPVRRDSVHSGHKTSMFRLDPDAATARFGGTPEDAYDVQTYLIQMNDEESLSFADIADWVERDL